LVYKLIKKKMRSKRSISRRNFTRTIAMTGIGSVGLPLFVGENAAGRSLFQSSTKGNFKISLNAYSFDKPLRQGTMSISDLLDYCARIGFDGVDLTGYYFPGYPSVPSDDYIYEVKRKAFKLGLGISGTGVRNDFTWSDQVKRAEEKKLVKEWIVVAAKLGAPLIRIFAGTLSKEAFTWEEKLKWIADDINECAGFGKNHGVMIALQNHNDFIKTASDVDRIFQVIDSRWVGLLLDIGSFHTTDPYSDIARNARYAISWQLKEKVFINDTQVDTDYSKIINIIEQCGYRGYLPLETLGEGDPSSKVEALYKKVQAVINV
jgi:sugar phosphate isomerase/epimerase